MYLQIRAYLHEYERSIEIISHVNGQFILQVVYSITAWTTSPTNEAQYSIRLNSCYLFSNYSVILYSLILRIDQLIIRVMLFYHLTEVAAFPSLISRYQFSHLQCYSLKYRLVY